MKYSSKRHFLHPVLRPFSDDYPEQKVTTQLSAHKETSADSLRISLSFDVGDGSVRSAVRDHRAVCVAMLYCGATLFRDTLQSAPGSLLIRESLPLRNLKDEVELHPAVVASCDLEDWPIGDAHTDYKGTSVRIPAFAPLAIDQTWRFGVNEEFRPTNSIFTFDVVETIEDDRYDLRLDTRERYIQIVSNSKTNQRLRHLRRNRTLSNSVLYFSALVEALATLRSEETEDGFPEHGWAQCLTRLLRRDSLDIHDGGKHTLVFAAQSLLRSPLELVFRELEDDDDASD